MKKLLLSLFFVLSLLLLNINIYAQDAAYTMTASTKTITSCRSTLDADLACISAGKTIYCNNVDRSYTFISGSGTVLNANLTLHILSDDFIYVYDGPSSASPLLATWTGGTAANFANGLNATSTGSIITIRFVSNNTAATTINAGGGSYYTGWSILIGCPPTSCNGNTPANDNCTAAPQICNLNGYCGNTSGWYNEDHPALEGQAAPGFGGSIENNSWINFVASATTATLVVTSANCLTSTSGIQGAVYATTNCSTFTPVTGGNFNQNAAAGTVTLNLSGLTAGTGYYLMLDGYGGNVCDYTVTAIGNVQTLNSTSSASSNTICPNQSFTVTATAGATSYSWNPAPASTSSNTAVYNNISTTTTITTTAFGYCGASATVALTMSVVSLPLNVTSATLCSGSSTVLTASGATSYTWAGSGLSSTTGATVTANPTVTTIYTVTGVSGSCSNVKTATVNVNPIPTTTASTTGTLTCTTLTVALNSTLAGVNYTWTAPAGGSVASANTQSTTASGSPGTYTLSVKSAAGCTFSTTTSVTQNTVAPTGVSAGSNQTLTCASSSVALTGTVLTPTNATVNWTGANVCGTATTLATFVCGAGVYTLTATNPSNGCTAASTVQVFPSAGAPTVTNNPVTNTITCTNTLVTVSISTTVTPVTILWTGPAISSGNGTGTITVTQGGTYQYTVTNTSNGCSTSNNQVVVQNTTIPTTTASTAGTLTCSSPTVALNSTLAGMNYTWTAPAGGSLGSANSQTTTASGAAGTYTIKVVNSANGCTFTTTTSITQNTTVPTTTASTTGSLSCTTATVALNSTLAGMNYTWTAPAGGSVGSANTQSTTASGAAGTYSLVVLNSTNGCTYSTTTSVTQNTTVPTTTASTTGTLNCTTSTVTLNSTLAGMNYTWTAPAGGSLGSANSQNTTASGAAGTYTIKVVNPTSGCSYTTTTAVTQNTTVPTTTASTTGSLSCATTTVALNSTLAGMNYTWTAPSGGSVGSANTQSTTASGTSGTYSLMVMNPANGCTYTTTTAVTQNTTVPTTTASTSGTLTCTTSSVSLNSTLAGMNYTWTAPAGGSVASANTQSTSASAAPGTYTLLVVNPSNGCTFATTTSVTQNTTAPTGVSAGSNQTLTCGSPSVALAGTVLTPTNATVNWTGANVCGTPTTVVTSACGAGIYTLTATDPANGCTASATVQVFPSAGAPAVTNDPVTNSITCTNTLVTVSISTTVTPVTILWAGTGISSGNGTATITVTQGGTFQYTVTDNSNGCSTSNNQMVIQNTTVPTTTASTTGTLTCSTTTVALNSTLSGMNYTWTAPSGGSVSTASTQATTASGAAGIYTISVVDPANGCSYTTTTAVTQNTAVPTSSASSTGTLTCVTSTVGLNSSLSGMNYTWTAPSGGSVSTNSTQATTASGAPGDYTLTVMDSSNGCTYTTTANVPQNIAIPTGVSAGSNQTLTCPSNSVTLTGSVSTPTNPTINWTGPNVCGTATTLVTSACAAGAYTLTVTDPLNGCSTASMVTVAPNAGSPTVTVSSSTLVIDCNNATRSVTVTSTPNTDVTFNWSPSPSSVSAIGDIATFNIANTYICTVTNTLSNCSTPVQVVVTTNTVAPSIAITGTQSLTCANPSAVISTTTSASVTYTWTGTLVSGQGTGTVTVNAAAIYTVNITDAANGCTNTASTQVVSDSNAPVATISVTSTNSVITCGNTSVNLLANVTPTTATYSYTWSPSGGNAAVANVTAPGIYVVTVLNPSTGCQQTSQPITIISNTTPPSATVNNATIACGASSTGIGGSAITTATNASFNWTTSGTGTIVGGSTSSPTVNASGQYVVTITDNNNGCTSTASVNVSQANVTAAFTANPLSGTAPLDVNFTNQSTGASGYSWNFGDLSSVTNISGATNPSHTFNTIGTYNVVLTASNGACTSTATISIEVLENSSIIVPNVFTPNGDHSNDVFKITSTGLETLNCDIFNRWGLKLFTISSPNDSWDGGSAVDGTYFFILTAKGFDGKEFKEQGFISLFR